MAKSPDAFRTISEVADWLGVQAHVLRFWESKFTQVKPVKRAGGRRYYRPADMSLIGGIKHLLHDEGMTIKGVQKILREQGVAHVSSFSPALDDSPAKAEPSNVVPFEPFEPRDPESAASADMPAGAPAEPAATDAPGAESAAGLPSFLTAPLERTAADVTAPDEAAPAALRPRIVDAPDPDQAAIPVSPGALARLAGLRRIDPRTAREITPFVARLAVLRDRLGASRKE